MIRLSAITKQYDKKRIAGPVTMEIGTGECVALVGGNGAGKSTTLRMIAGLLQPSDGELVIGGHRAGTKGAKNQLFYLPQKLVLPGHMTLKEAVQFFVQMHRRQPPDLNHLAAIYGLSDVVDSRISTFSGGMMQRLGLLIVDAVDTPILLLDEPTSNLDTKGIQLFFERMNAWRQNGKTIVFATHTAAEINELADRCIVMESGRVQEDLIPTTTLERTKMGVKGGYQHA